MSARSYHHLNQSIPREDEMRRPNGYARRLLGMFCLSLPALPSYVWSAISAPAIDPPFLVVGPPTPTTISAYIPDPGLIPTSVNLLQLDTNGRVLANLGTLLDDGTKSDRLPGDRVYTIQKTLTATVPGQARFRISAALLTLLPF